MANPFDEVFIDRIYDAALKPELWSELLVNIADMMRSSLGIACGMSASEQNALFCHYGRCEPPRDAQLGRRHLLNPWTIAVQQEAVGRVLPSHRIMPLRDLRRTEFYADILAPEKIDHCVITKVCRAKDVNFTFSIMRGEKTGIYTDHEIANLRSLLPHLRRSAMMRLNLDAYEALSFQQQQVLDRIDTGIVLVDELGRFFCVNQAAEALMHADNGLSLSANMLAAKDARITRKLLSLVSATAEGGPGGSMAIPRDSILDPLLVLVCPIRGMVRDTLSAPGVSRRTVALFIKDPLRGFSDLDGVLTPLFHLTQAEIRVALALGSGQSIAGASVCLGISQNTVKTHAKRIYEKMGVTNHAELVKKVSRLASF